MQEYHLPVIEKLELYIRLGEWLFVHWFYITDNSACWMHNVILRNDLGKKAGLIINLTEQPIYNKDMFLLLSALDQPFKPDVRHVFDDGVSTPGVAREWNLSNLTKFVQHRWSPRWAWVHIEPYSLNQWTSVITCKDTNGQQDPLWINS